MTFAAHSTLAGVVHIFVIIFGIDSADPPSGR